MGEGGQGRQSTTTFSLVPILDLSKLLLLSYALVLASDRSKYPPAEPEALRLLAPQRDLIATGEKQLQRHEAREATGFGNNEDNSGRHTPGILKV